jgi:hypothetical protein
MDHRGVEHIGRRWRERIVLSDTLDYDAHDGHLVVNEELMPPLPRAVPTSAAGLFAWPVRRLRARLRNAR